MTNISSLLHGKCITYNKIASTLPDRSKLLDPEDVQMVNQILTKNKPMLFLPTFLYETHMQDEKYAKAIYKIVLIGIFPDGRRVNVVLDGIEPYFEILVPDGNIDEQSAFVEKVLTTYSSYSSEKGCDVNPIRKTIISSKPFKHFQEHKSKFIRLYYNKLKNRSAAMTLASQNGWRTYSDDKSSYYRTVCRDNLVSFSTWSLLDNYRSEEFSNLKGDSYRLNIADYKDPFPELQLPKKKGDVNNIKSCNIPNDKIKKDKTLTCCWDIETFSYDKAVPQPNRKSDCIFCIGLTFQWVHDKNSFLRVCLCDYPSDPCKDVLTIICGSEQNMLQAFSEIIGIVKPDFIFGFNDSDYDWNWVVRRAADYPGLLSQMANNMEASIPYNAYTDESLLNYSFKKTTVKIDAQTMADGRALMLNGYIPVDVRTVFRKLDPNSEKSSLKYFLEKNKLGGKEDMPYQRLFEIYSNYRKFITAYEFKGRTLDLDMNSMTDNNKKEYLEHKKNLAEVNYYCVIDAQRCHDLMRQRSVILDAREVSHLAYTSCYDAFYYANGMKVVNMTTAFVQQWPFNKRFSQYVSKEVRPGKYPGAYVFPPKKGLKVSKLSIEERCNSDPKWKDTTDEEKETFKSIVKNHGAVLNEEQFELAEQTYGKLPSKFKDFIMEEIDRPIVGLDYASLYPSLMRAYNLSPEYFLSHDRKKEAKSLETKGEKIIRVEFLYGTDKIVGFFIWHKCQYEPDPDDLEGKNFRFGVYPYLLNKLFLRRKELKKKLGVIKDEIEKLRLITNPDKETTSRLEDLDFEYTCLNSKQNALKVFMNTFYGVAGNKLSPMFLLELAGGITSRGQENIKRAQTKVENLGCKVYYGDTDSLYISIPDGAFHELDRKYYSGEIAKLDYWTELVKITFVEINKVRDAVNTMLKENNGTDFLSMAYEEVLWPVAFLAKKKYYGIPHEKEINFLNYKMFIRGLEVKKRGVSDLLKKSFMEIMNVSCDVTNTKTLLELVHQKVKDIYSKKWDLKDFIQTAVYNPTKKNVKVRTYVQRMQERGIEIKPNERFNYIIAKIYPYTYDLRGRKRKLSVGDRMESLDYAMENKLDVDLDYYMEGSVNGQLARLITYHKMFHVEPLDNTEDELKAADIRIYNNACKYVEDYCAQYYTTYNTFGKAYQKMFRTANKLVAKAVSDRDDGLSGILSANVNYQDFQGWIEEYTSKQAYKEIGNYGEEFINAELRKVVSTAKEIASAKVIKKKEEDVELTEPEHDIKLERKRIAEIAKKAKLKRISELQTLYCTKGTGIWYRRKAAYDNQLSVHKTEISGRLTDIMKVFAKYNKSVLGLIQIIKQKIDVNGELEKPVSEAKDYTLDDFKVKISGDMEKKLKAHAEVTIQSIFEDESITENMNHLKQIYDDMLKTQILWAKTDSIKTYLDSIRDKANKITILPNAEQVREQKERDLKVESDEIEKLQI